MNVSPFLPHLKEGWTEQCLPKNRVRKGKDSDFTAETAVSQEDILDPLILSPDPHPWAEHEKNIRQIQPGGHSTDALRPNKGSVSTCETRANREDPVDERTTGWTAAWTLEGKKHIRRKTSEIRKKYGV